MSIILSDSVQIREVWNDNLTEEIELIRGIVDKHNYVALDTEYPGKVIYLNRNDFPNVHDFNYQEMKANVDTLKLIQLGLTFFDEHGNLPKCGTDKFCIWQFNFREFNDMEDPHAKESIQLLGRSGIDFKKNNEKGIDANRFGELLTSSGIVMNETQSVNFVTFHGGFDIGFLIKLLTGSKLPDARKGFFDLINIYFRTVYDIKYMIRHCDGLYGGLDTVAEKLEVERVGVSHQAGSDSLLTCLTFIKVRDTRLNSDAVKKHAGFLFGLNAEGEPAD